MHESKITVTSSFLCGVTKESIGWALFSMSIPLMPNVPVFVCFFLFTHGNNSGASSGGGSGSEHRSGSCRVHCGWTSCTPGCNSNHAAPDADTHNNGSNDTEQDEEGDTQTNRQAKVH